MNTRGQESQLWAAFTGVEKAELLESAAEYDTKKSYFLLKLSLFPNFLLSPTRDAGGR